MRSIRDWHRVESSEGNWKPLGRDAAAAFAVTEFRQCRAVLLGFLTIPYLSVWTLKFND